MRRRAGEQLGRLLEGWTTVVARHAAWVLVASLIAGGLGLWAAVQGLGLNTDTAEMLSAELPFRKTWERYKHAFPQFGDTVVLVIDAPAPEIADDAADTLLALLSARDDVLTDVHRPDGDAFLRQRGLLFLDARDLDRLGDDLARYQPLLARLARDPSLPTLLDLVTDALGDDARDQGVDVAPMLTRLDRAIRAQAAGRTDVLSWQELLADGGDPGADRRRFVVARPRLDYARLSPAETALTAVRDAVREVEGHGLVRVQLTGAAALAHDEMQTVIRGTLRMTLIALVMVGVTLWAALRSVRLILVTLITLGLGVIITAGVAALTVGRLNMISIAFVVLYVGLGVDYAIHLCLRYRELIGRGHHSIIALRGCVHSVGPALVLCAVSTAIGFFSFTPTAFRGVSELGVIAGSGMFVSLAVSLSVLPALLAVLPLPRVTDPPHAPPPHPVRPLLDALARRRGAVRIASGVLALGCLVAVPRIGFDYIPINLQDPAVESVAVARELASSDRDAPATIVILETDAPAARARAERLRDLPHVRRVVTLEDFVAGDQEEKIEIIRDLDLILGPSALDVAAPIPASGPEQIEALRRLDAALARAGESRTQVAALLERLQAADAPTRRRTLAELQRSLLMTFAPAVERLRDALAAETYTIDDLPPALRARWISPDGLHRVEVSPTTDLTNSANLREFVDEVRTVAPQATGEPVVLLEAGEAVIRSLQQAFIGALVAIGILLALLRGVRDALLILLPLLLAGALTGAASAVLDIPFNFANVVALPLLLGIGVDSGIHIVQRMHWGASPPEALLHTSTARAVLYSALTTIFSFGTLAFTAHRGTASMGQLLTLGIVFTLIATLIVLPAFLPTPKGPAKTAGA